MATAQHYIDVIERYESTFQQWEQRADKVMKRYKDDTTDRIQTNGTVRFNILWSNVQTLSAATFAKLPKADVERRFKDNDPVGRVASLLLGRALTYEIEHYPDYAETLRAVIMDRFLGGRGTAWARYEPHMRAVQQQQPVDGVQITDDADEADEEIEYECAPTDYVAWKDFGHEVARTWEEVGVVWRRVYLDREAATKRFKDRVKGMSFDTDPQKDLKAYAGTASQRSKACVYEIWDKRALQATWLQKGLPEILDQRDDPLQLHGFFPCPKPLYATLTTESLIPLPDFTLYQDQAALLDLLADRIDGLVKALKIRGTYDNSIPALARIFEEDTANSLVPVENWAQFVEKGGLKGALDLVEIEPIAQCLQHSYMAMEQVKGQVYEVTGISDIIRGQTVASETATAQQLKGQYASLRLKAYQDEVARFATQLIRLKAQIICQQFMPDTILKMASADQLQPVDQKLLQPALALLLGDRMVNPNATTPNPLRAFRIEIAADSMVYLDEQEEKDNRVEFLTAAGQFLSQAVKTAQMFPQVGPLLIEMMRFGASGFKAAKVLEGVLDQTLQQVQQVLMQPPQQPQANPVEETKARAEIARSEADIVKANMEVKKAQAEGQMVDNSAARAQQQAEAGQTVVQALQSVASLLMSLAEAQASQSLQREASDAAVNNIGAQTAQLLDFAQRPKKKDVRIVTDGSGMPIGAEVTEIPT